MEMDLLSDYRIWVFFFDSMHISNNKRPKKLQESSGDFISGGDKSGFSEPFAVSFVSFLFT